MKILYHAINSIGVGHLSRLIGVAGGIREINPGVSQLFLTEVKETKFLKLHNFPYFPLPSFHAVQKDQEWLGILKSKEMWVNNVSSLIHAYNPDIMIYDTATWAEVSNAVRTCQVKPKEVFILRARRDMKRYFEENQEIFSHLDLLVFPHSEDELNPAEIPPYLRKKYFVSGSILRRDVSEINKEVIEEKYAVEDDSQFIITVTNGGGNSLQEDKEHFLQDVLQAIFNCDDKLPPNYKVIVVAGPLLLNITLPSIHLPHGELIIREYEPLMIDLMALSNLVICRGGYNTINEVISINTPTIAIPAERLSDDQFSRVEKVASKSDSILPIRIEMLEDALINIIPKAVSWKFCVPEVDVRKKNKLKLAERILSL